MASRMKALRGVIEGWLRSEWDVDRWMNCGPALIAMGGGSYPVGEQEEYERRLCKTLRAFAKSNAYRRGLLEELFYSHRFELALARIEQLEAEKAQLRARVRRFEDIRDNMNSEERQAYVRAANAAG